MFSLTKAISNIVKGFTGNVDLSNGDTLPFYPLSNSSYYMSSLSRTDYLKLYKWIAYRCVDTISDAVWQLDFVLQASKKNDKELEHSYLDLIDFDFLKQLVSSLQLTGSAYFWKFKIGNKIESLEFLRSDMIVIEEEANGFLKGYRYHGGGVDKFFPPDEVLVFNLFSPIKSYPHVVKGFSPMQAVAIQAEMDGAATTWQWNFFKNNASSRDVLMTEHNVTPETLERLEAKRNMNHKGVNNSHKTAILPNGLKYQNIDVSQREMDFVESRRFTRDEILAIFNVPKSMVGIVEDVNRANAQSNERIFAKNCIKPLADQIQNQLNKDLFKWVWYFHFVNVVPIDTEQLTNDLNNGAITINEYRQARGFRQIKEGDKLKLSPFLLSENVTYENQENAKWKDEYDEIIWKELRKHIKGTAEHKSARDQRGEAKYAARNARLRRYEEKYIKVAKEMFEMQCRDIVREISTNKTAKWVDTKAITWDIVKYLAIWESFIFPAQKELVSNEWNEAYAEIWLTTLFDTGDPEVNKRMRANINKFAKDVDKTTRTKIIEVIEDWNLNGLWSDQIARNITDKFDEFSRVRAQRIARTEITRAANYAEETAWIKSWVVNEKERYTAHDERTCPHCRSMDGQILKLWENYFDKGDQMENDGQVLPLKYDDVKHPPLHPDCRCTLLPVTK